MTTRGVFLIGAWLLSTALGAADEGETPKIAKTILVSFREELGLKEAHAALKKHGLDPDAWIVHSWDKHARQVMYRKKFSDERLKDVQQALEGAAVWVSATEYAVGRASVGFKKGVTKAQARRVLKKLTLAKGAKFHNFPWAVTATIRGIRHGKEWDVIDKLREQKIVDDAQIEGIVRAL